MFGDKIYPSDHLGGGFKYFFIFTPIWGRFPFLLIFFKWGWFNHQLAMDAMES